MRIQKLILLGALYVVVVPTRAHAEWFATPFVGAAFAGSVPEGSRLDYGVAAGWLGPIAGFEVDISHRPEFFEVADVPAFLLSDSSVTTVMFNGLFRVPWDGKRLRPYAAGGVGWLRTRIGAEDDFVRGTSSNFGFNVGGGVMAHLSDRIGLRGDIRYFRDLQELEMESEFFSFGDDKLDFWRATVGVAIRF